MASLTKKSITRYLDADGKQVRKSALAVRNVTTMSRKWYGQYADEHGITREAPPVVDRSPAKMMRLDLASARAAWVAESHDAAERERREASDFLRYENDDGLFADFHANRHTFITRLGRSNVPMATAQRLARHSDPRLTADVYTHIDASVKADAIASLEGLRATEETDARCDSDSFVGLEVALTDAKSGQDALSRVTDGHDQTARVVRDNADWQLSRAGWMR